MLLIKRSGSVGLDRDTKWQVDVPLRKYSVLVDLSR